MPQSLSSAQKLEHFLTRMARDREVAASTQDQALNAILFFYKEVLGEGHDGQAANRKDLTHEKTGSQADAVLFIGADRAHDVFRRWDWHYAPARIPPNRVHSIGGNKECVPFLVGRVSGAKHPQNPIRTMSMYVPLGSIGFSGQS
jgi:hypothetical protein